MSILIDQTTPVLIQGITGWAAQRHVRYMLDYGTKVVGGVTPGKGGTIVEGVPVFDSVQQAVRQLGPVGLATSFVPPRGAVDAAREAIDAGIRVLHIAAEGVPVRDTIRLVDAARNAGARVIGPNSQGIITPGQAKVGGSGGDRPSRMFTPGRIGVISRSGGMGAETCWLLSRNGLGQSTYVAIGGETISGSGYLDIARLFESDADTDALVCFGEPGGVHEEELATAYAAGEITKPIVAYVAGTFMETRADGVSFGHAGAVVNGSSGAPSSKKTAMRDVGISVADRWSDIPTLVQQALGVDAME